MARPPRNDDDDFEDEPDDAGDDDARGFGDHDDPAMQSKLAQWFGGAEGQKVTAIKAAETVDENDPALGLFTAAEVEERRKQIEKASAAADPALVAFLEAQAEYFAQALKPRPEPKLTMDNIQARDFSPPAWGLRLAGDERIVERPDDVKDALADSTPQAVLRDLYRPEPRVGPIRLRPMALDELLDPETGRRWVREMFAQSYKWSPGATMTQQIRESQVELRLRLTEPWEKFEKPVRPELSAEDRIMMTIGFSGVDPDV